MHRKDKLDMKTETHYEKLSSLSKEELVNLILKLSHQNNTVETFLENLLLNGKDNFLVVHKKIQKLMSKLDAEYQKAFNLYDFYIKTTTNYQNALSLSCDFMDWLIQEAETYSDTLPDTLLMVLSYVFEMSVKLAQELDNQLQIKRLLDILTNTQFTDDINEVLNEIYYEFLPDLDEETLNE